MTVTMGLFRSNTSHPSSSSTSISTSPPKTTNDQNKDPSQRIPRSHTVHHLSSHFHKSSSSKDFKEQIVPEMGVSRSCTDPLDKKLSNESSTHSGTQSGSSSGTSSPKRISASMDIVRGIYERPSSVIPKYYVVAEQYHKYKMRHCPGMYCTDEETAGIKKMQAWNWKHATHPGEAPPPIGPKNESWHFEGVALEQILTGHTKIVEEDENEEEFENEEEIEEMKELKLRDA